MSCCIHGKPEVSSIRLIRSGQKDWVEEVKIIAGSEEQLELPPQEPELPEIKARSVVSCLPKMSSDNFLRIHSGLVLHMHFELL